MLICIALVIVDPCKTQRFENFYVIMSKLLDMPEISRFYGIIITMYLPITIRLISMFVTMSIVLPLIFRRGR